MTIYIIGHRNPDTDSICSAIGYAHFKNQLEKEDYKAVRAGDINKETEFVLKKFGVDVPPLMKNAAGKDIILVDHNETGQVLDGMNEAEVFEIVDHHRIGNFETARPILFHAEPVGSTSTIVADFYFYHKIKMPKAIAGCLLGAILSDTIIFKSPTTTEKDRRIAKELAKIVEIDSIEEFGLEVKRAKATFEGINGNKILLSDFKNFDFGATKIGIGQAEVVGFEEVNSKKPDILKAMKNLFVNKGYSAVLFMATDIIREATELFVFAGDHMKNELETVYGKKIANDVIVLPGVVSRKSQVIPPLQKHFV